MLCIILLPQPVSALLLLVGSLLDPSCWQPLLFIHSMATSYDAAAAAAGRQQRGGPVDRQSTMSTGVVYAPCTILLSLL